MLPREGIPETRGFTVGLIHLKVVQLVFCCVQNPITFSLMLKKLNLLDFSKHDALEPDVSDPSCTGDSVCTIIDSLLFKERQFLKSYVIYFHR